MLGKVIIENGVKKIQALTADTGTGAPVGSYLMLEKKSNPQGYLYCDGSTFDSSVYPALYQYLGTNVLPDWREFSPVGAEQNTTNVYDASTNPSGVIHDHDVYAEGESKDDQLQEHSHSAETNDTKGNSSQDVGYMFQPSGSFIKSPSNSSQSGRAGTVTRGKRKAVFVYIKATSGLTENQQENVLNTINENLSYSTTEHKTGKKWIDGKPIYRKTIDCGALPNNTTKNVAHNITNLKFVIKLEGFAYATGGVNLPIPYIASNDQTYNVSVDVNATYVSLKDGADLSPYSVSYVTIEYTKTTD